MTMTIWTIMIKSDSLFRVAAVIGIDLSADNNQQQTINNQNKTFITLPPTNIFYAFEEGQKHILYLEAVSYITGAKQMKPCFITTRL